MTDVQTRTGAEPQHHDEPARGGDAATRRAVLAGAGALGATCLLAACGTANNGGSNGNNPNGSDYHANPAPAGSTGAVTGNARKPVRGAGGAGGTALAAVSEVPKGGGIIKGDYVITQPSAGTFKAFSKVCTHAGCDVNKIDAGVIKCPCHGSTFSIEDGSVQGGPAPKGLPETKVKVSGDNVVTA
jgi:Rieske Fe-S protein